MLLYNYLTVVDQKQFDPLWASYKTSCLGTMQSEGCYITGTSMALNFLGKSTTPLSVLNALKPTKADCPLYWGGAASTYGVSHSTTAGNFSSLKAAMFDEIYYNHRPVVATVNGHAVLVRAFDGILSTDASNHINKGDITSDMFYINDPGSSSRTKLQQVITAYSDITSYHVFY
jgi:hypothetical protein